MIESRLVVERPGFRLDVELDVAAGEVVALLGPNGAGKTTALRALAGLVPVTGGHIRLDGEPIHDTPADRRPVGMVFQDYLLFPHLSALDNVAFGPRCHGTPKRRARLLAAEWLERVGLAGYAAARPHELSGGQAQRVALARALAVRPRMLLLDEPLAALDAHTRLDIRARLHHHLRDFDGAAVLVTHDPLDAMVLADRLVVVEDGAVVQQGPPPAVARHPRTEYVARLVGLNLYRGEADGHAVRLEGITLNTAESHRGPVFLAFPPTAVALYRTRPDGTPRNLWEAVIGGVERHGDHARVLLGGPLEASADVTAAAVAELDLRPGERVWAALKATETHAYPA
ncbi:molybdate transport system ATP-binding protein [Streptosporangium becharense]|uniref:ABC-type quaternary amine transporter n=1 Tax=Streptosporangium becharense TaxID=1816182 RepID=A0A7W9MI18_9ACTN|nr:ABC transporter ATP-binding protein [Streptosporangium becharense]MBB2911215.1 molybdate transport system ATP-binding protein [Streptosporangium becharense]MBB5821727.1 molybdate transport system ATP-binding protein [Streptosporangium becharense]